MFMSVNSTDCLLGPAFELEVEVLCTSILEPFFIDCVSSLKDFIAYSMNARKTPICCSSWMLN